MWASIPNFKQIRPWKASRQYGKYNEINDHLKAASECSGAAPRRLRLYDPLTGIVSLFLAAELF